MSLKTDNFQMVSRIVISSKVGCFQDKVGMIYVRCASCLEAKKLSEFDLRLSKDDGALRNLPYCKACRFAVEVKETEASLRPNNDPGDIL